MQCSELNMIPLDNIAMILHKSNCVSRMDPPYIGFSKHLPYFRQHCKRKKKYPNFGKEAQLYNSHSFSLPLPLVVKKELKNALYSLIYGKVFF